MKLGMVLITVGVVRLIALVVLLVMNLIMGNYIVAIYGTIALGIFVGISLSKGIKKMRQVKQ